MGRRASDLTGQRFGSLVAEYRAGNDKAGYAMWVCTCDCGGMHHVRSANLKSEAVTRCKRCQRLNLNPNTAEGGVNLTVVDTWVHAVGLEGGFAVARDAAGVVKALTPWSRQAQNLNREPEGFVLVRRCMKLLVQAGHVRPPADKEGPKRWLHRVNVQANAPRRLVGWPEMLRQWLAAGGSIENAHPDARPPAPMRVVPIAISPLDTTPYK